MHLRKGLSAQAVAWIDQNGNAAAPTRTERIPPTSSSDLGIHSSVQDLLSKIRTDLDSFTDIEAYSLMLDGYLLSEPELKKLFGASSPITSPPWQFMEIRQWMAHPTTQYLNHLEIGQEKLFKVFRLSWTVTLLTAFTLGLVGWGGWLWQNDQLIKFWNSTISVKLLISSVAVLALGFLPWASRTFKLLRLIRSPSEFLTRLALRGLVPVIGSLIVWIHLAFFDPLFLTLGRIKRLRPPS
jgi:NTE family protein